MIIFASLGCYAGDGMEEEDFGYSKKKKKKGHWNIHCTSIYYLLEEIMD